MITCEISSVSNFFRKINYHSPFKNNEREVAISKLKVSEEIDFPQLYILDGLFNFNVDAQKMLMDFNQKLKRSDRAVMILYNPYYRLFYKFLKFLKIIKTDLPETFITKGDLADLFKLSKNELIKVKSIGHFPFWFMGLGTLLNKFLSSFKCLDSFGYAYLVYFRAIITENPKLSLSIIVPARNEKGNIKRIVSSIPTLDTTFTEVIFVEGGSTDGTWEEIKTNLLDYKGPLRLSQYKQTESGKWNAVLEGVKNASGELIVILDADLTVPADKLENFYFAYKSGLGGDFINGTRLFYPMEKQAMKPLNKLGNIFFAKLISYLIGIRLTDTLCGSKMLTRVDFKRMLLWKKQFGDFDPFGDFNLIFFSSELSLGVINLPVHYKDRTYGETNIRRFYHGLMLLKMCWISLFKIKMIKSRLF